MPAFMFNKFWVRSFVVSKRLLAKLLALAFLPGTTLKSKLLNFAILRTKGKRLAETDERENLRQSLAAKMTKYMSKANFEPTEFLPR